MEDNLIQHWWNLQHYSHCAEWKAYMQKIRLRFPPLPAYFFECVLYNNFYHRNFFKLFLYIQLCVSSKCLCCVVWWMKSWMYEWSREMCSKGQSLKKGYFFFFLNTSIKSSIHPLLGLFMKMILYEKLFCYTRNDKSQRADNQLNQIKNGPKQSMVSRKCE